MRRWHIEAKNRKTKRYALRGNRTPGGSSQYSNGNDPGYHYPINAMEFMRQSQIRCFIHRSREWARIPSSSYQEG